VFLKHIQIKLLFLLLRSKISFLKSFFLFLKLTFFNYFSSLHNINTTLEGFLYQGCSYFCLLPVDEINFRRNLWLGHTLEHFQDFLQHRHAFRVLLGRLWRGVRLSDITNWFLRVLDLLHRLNYFLRLDNLDLSQVWTTNRLNTSWFNWHYWIAKLAVRRDII
jgi:hypothetical protein